MYWGLMMGHDNAFAHWHNFLDKQGEDVDIIVCNGMLTFSNYIIPRNPKLIKEYYSKEHKIADKVAMSIILQTLDSLKSLTRKL